MIGLWLVGEILLLLLAGILWLMDRRQLYTGYCLTGALVTLLSVVMMALGMTGKVLWQIWTLIAYVLLYTLCFMGMSYQIKHFWPKRVTLKAVWAWFINSPLHVQILPITSLALLIYLVTANTVLGQVGFIAWYNRLCHMLLIYFAFIWVSLVFSHLVLCYNPKDDAPEYVLVLGQSLTHNKMTRNLVRRLTKGLEIYHRFNEQPLIVVSGGRTGLSELSEAQAMADYLMSKGLSDQEVMIEDQSQDTATNMLYSKRLIHYRNREETGVFVTSDYHLVRASLYAQRAGLRAVGIGIATDDLYTLEDYLRHFFKEWVAILYVNRFIHLAVIGLAVIGSLIVM